MSTHDQQAEQEERERVRRLMEGPRAVFVFGANEAGRHGAGAAKDAVRLYGARRGQGFGLVGRSYALPTKDANLRRLPLEAVANNVSILLTTARVLRSLDFVVTKVGCGLAGFREEEIAALFKDAPQNCHLPLGWREKAASKEDTE